MTPSEKPQPSQDSADANQSTVSTQTVEDGSDAAGTGASKVEDTGAGEGTAQTDSTPAPSSTEDGAGSPELTGTAAPPPWQRAAATAQVGPPPDNEDTQTIPKPPSDLDTIRTAARGGDVGSDAAEARTSVSFSGGAETQRPAFGTGGATSAQQQNRRTSRGPRRASLQVKRVDPWSVLKLALVLSIALFFVWMIAVAVLYGVLDGMGVWEQLNGTFTELVQQNNATSEPLISAGRVFGIAAIIGGINIVLLTALATVGAFIYNVAADVAGGVELTLSERE